MGLGPKTQEYLPQNIISFGGPAMLQRQLLGETNRAAHLRTDRCALFDQCADKSNNLLRSYTKKNYFLHRNCVVLSRSGRPNDHNQGRKTSLQFKYHLSDMCATLQYFMCLGSVHERDGLIDHGLDLFRRDQGPHLGCKCLCDPTFG